MNHAITQLTTELRGLKQGLNNLHNDKAKKLAERNVLQKGIDHISSQIAAMDTRIEETEAALTLLNATQFITDESKGSISAEDLGL